jgi:uncharacterized protein YecT (DUF1311 family)
MKSTQFEDTMVSMLKIKLFDAAKASCLGLISLAAVASMCFIAHDASGATTQMWPLEYRDMSTNRFIWDKRVPSLIRSKLHPSFAALVTAALGGPPNPVTVLQDRFFAASACVPHYCPEKGFFWLDTRTGEGLGAIIIIPYPGNVGELRLNSKVIRGELPEHARQSIIDWLDEQNIVATAVEFIDATGISRSLPAVDFQAPPKFDPPAGGPSFDCANAATRIEQALCTDPELAALDLKLYDFYRLLRGGLATIPDRKQVTDLQQMWLKKTNAACVQSDVLNVCLNEQYLLQLSSIQTWVPTSQTPSRKR